MKKLTTLLVLGPGAAFAHGGHAELAGPAHDGFHATPWIGVGLIAVALVLALIRERGE
jgi:hypothetical protein